MNNTITPMLPSSLHRQGSTPFIKPKIPKPKIPDTADVSGISFMGQVTFQAALPSQIAADRLFHCIYALGIFFLMSLSRSRASLSVVFFLAKWKRM